MKRVVGTESVRLAELAASLSLATDIGLGVALEHAQRSALLAVALADAAGVDADEARDAYYVALLKTVGCVGDEDFGVRVLGEDLTLYRGDSGKAYLVARRCAHRGVLRTGLAQGAGGLLEIRLRGADRGGRRCHRTARRGRLRR